MFTPLVLSFDRRMKATGITYVMIEVGLVPMDVDIGHQRCPVLPHATLIILIHISTSRHILGSDLHGLSLFKLRFF